MRVNGDWPPVDSTVEVGISTDPNNIPLTATATTEGRWIFDLLAPSSGYFVKARFLDGQHDLTQTQGPFTVVGGQMSVVTFDFNF